MMCLGKTLWPFLHKSLQLDYLSFQESHKGNCLNDRHVQNNIRCYSKLFKCSLMISEIDAFQPQEVNKESLKLPGGWWKRLRDYGRSMHHTSHRGDRHWVSGLGSEEGSHELNSLVSRHRWWRCHISLRWRASTSTQSRKWGWAISCTIKFWDIQRYIFGCFPCSLYNVIVRPKSACRSYISYHCSGPYSNTSHIETNMLSSNWVDVAGSLLTVLSRVLLALPLFLDMLGMNAMQLLYSRVHVQAWNLVEY